MRLSHPGQKTTKPPPLSSARFTGFRGWIGVVGVEKKRLLRRKSEVETASPTLALADHGGQRRQRLRLHRFGDVDARQGL
ncbi:hypothetical protein DEO72_LG11g1908 [Vigna unguiculata]|uniref:Uncharacterized protein n=1 Tax=Vigna unguiculata TaxID=3917 RepID=A0A4D6NPH9_VIGUN|nr:hypothetical protein DEO72_LG11g1908 [Vigna unguiculata]